MARPSRPRTPASSRKSSSRASAPGSRRAARYSPASSSRPKASPGRRSASSPSAPGGARGARAGGGRLPQGLPHLGLQGRPLPRGKRGPKEAPLRLTGKAPAVPVSQPPLALQLLQVGLQAQGLQYRLGEDPSVDGGPLQGQPGLLGEPPRPEPDLGQDPVGKAGRPRARARRWSSTRRFCRAWAWP